MAVLGLRFCARAFSSCGERGPLFIAVRRPLTIAASVVAEHRLQARRLSSCGSRAQLLRGMWDLPRPGLEPVSPALAGGFSTTVPPGKPLFLVSVGFSLEPETLKLSSGSAPYHDGDGKVFRSFWRGVFPSVEWEKESYCLPMYPVAVIHTVIHVFIHSFLSPKYVLGSRM